MNSNYIYKFNSKTPWSFLLENLKEKSNPNSLFNLINFMCENTPLKSSNINLFELDSSSLSILNPFHILYNNLNSSNMSNDEKNLWDRLIQHGMIFSQDFNLYENNQPYSSDFDSYDYLANIVNTNTLDNLEITLSKSEKFTKTINNFVFSKPIPKNIYFINQYIKDFGIEETIKKVIHFELFHKAVSENQIIMIDYLLNNLKLSINTLDSSGNTPIMLANNTDTLNHLFKYNPNLIHKNLNNDDCISIFSNSRHDKQLSINLIYLSENYIKNNPKFNIISKENNEKRIENNLINLVENDKTKEELLKYLKNNNIPNKYFLTNSNGENLAYICLKKQNWSRFSLFYNDENKNFKTPNEFNNYLNLLFSFCRVSREKDAGNILGTLLYQDENFSNTLMHKLTQDVNGIETIYIPRWIIENNNFIRYIQNQYKISVPSHRDAYTEKNSSYFSLTDDEFKRLNHTIEFYMQIINFNLVNKEQFNINFNNIIVTQTDDMGDNKEIINMNVLNKFIVISNQIPKYKHLFSEETIKNIDNTYEILQSNFLFYIKNYNEKNESTSAMHLAFHHLIKNKKLEFIEKLEVTDISCPFFKLTKNTETISFLYVENKTKQKSNENTSIKPIKI